MHITGSSFSSTKHLLPCLNFSLTHGDWGWDSVASIGTRLWVEQPRNYLIPRMVRGFIFPKISRLVLGSTQLPIQGVLVGKMAGVWRWQPNMRLVPRLLRHTVVPPFLPYAFLECTGRILPFAHGYFRCQYHLQIEVDICWICDPKFKFCILVLNRTAVKCILIWHKQVKVQVEAVTCKWVWMKLHLSLFCGQRIQTHGYCSLSLKAVVKWWLLMVNG